MIHYFYRVTMAACKGPRTPALSGETGHWTPQRPLGSTPPREGLVWGGLLGTNWPERGWRVPKGQVQGCLFYHMDCSNTQFWLLNLQQESCILSHSVCQAHDLTQNTIKPGAKIVAYEQALYIHIYTRIHTHIYTHICMYMYEIKYKLPFL